MADEKRELEEQDLEVTDEEAENVAGGTTAMPKLEQAAPRLGTIKY
jgi:hypothetical protein